MLADVKKWFNANLGPPSSTRPEGAKSHNRH